MFSRLYYCVAIEHDLQLVLVAALLCALSAVATVATVRRAVAADPQRRPAWLVGCGFVTGAGVWGTHFVSMLAFHAPISLSFELAPTVASLLLVVLVSMSGWTFAVLAGTRLAGVLGGGVVGAGVAMMHFMSINAMDLGATIHWNPVAVLLATGWGVVCSSVSASLLRNPDLRVGVGAAATAFLLGVVGLHFGGMSAMTLAPDVVPQVSGDEFSSKLLGIAVALGVVPIVGFGLASAVLDRYLGQNRRAQIARIRTLANATFEGLAVIDDDHMLEVNDRFCEMLGLTREDLISMPLHSIALGEAAVQALGQVSDGNPVTCRLRCGDSAGITAQVKVRTMDFDGRTTRIFAFRDVSAEESAHERIVHLAHHDALTGLPNRLRFRECLSEQLALACGNGSQVAIMFFDLDRFKDVNDVHGHAAGDALLVSVAQRMLAALPERAIVSRLSGDEFAVLLPDAGSRESAIALAQGVVTLVGAPQLLGSVQVTASASGGVTMFPLDGEDPDKLMNQADLALYRAKAMGRNCICDYDPELNAQIMDRRQLEADLSHAIEAGLLDVHFQPQALISSGEIVGFEALVRWHDKARGFVSPTDFVKLAEETGQILKLGEWVLQEGCREAVKWPGDPAISVNVSPAQFKQGNLVLTVETALRQSGLDPARLTLEITEGVLIDDEARAMTLLRHLKELGVQLAIDDFGTGYSSLNYLRAFPFDEIKIDRAFITGIESNREAQIIVRASIDLARDLGMTVVVEGVECFDELNALGDYSDVILQGYLLSRPLTRGAVAGFFSTSHDLRQAIAGAALFAQRRA